MSSLSLSNSILKKAVSLSWPRLVEKDHRDSLYMELCLEIIDFHRGAIAASVQSRKTKTKSLTHLSLSLVRLVREDPA